MLQAGLFSAVTSAFIIEVNSQLKPDPNDETAALLRVLIYKTDSTTFGDGPPPTLPQWTGPPHTVVQVQAILFASLAASLFSAFLAMLGKQWLNKYASIDMRGSAIERCQNRQRKLNGIISWYFDHVMESLPLMLQVALLLLGCALSRYFWEINTTVASVILAITSFGVLLYLIIIFVGAASVSCPYQTPGSNIFRRILDTPYHLGNAFNLIHSTYRRIRGIFRRILDAFRRIPATFRRIPHVPGTIYSFFSVTVKQSVCCEVLVAAWYDLWQCRHTPSDIGATLSFVLFSHILLLPVWLVMDACRAIIWVLVVFAHQAQQGSEQREAVLDQHCISWMLRTSLDGPVRLSTLSYLATVTPADLEPTLIVNCFDTLIGSVKVIEREVVITQGMEQLVAVSALCCLHMLSHLTTTDPQSMVLLDTCHRYYMIFPGYLTYNHSPLPLALRLLHVMVPYRLLGRFVTYCWEDVQRVEWEACNLSSNDHAVTARALAVIARVDPDMDGKVSSWLLRFVLHSLSQSPPPSTSVVISCLSIIAGGLRCDPPNTAILDERCVRI